MDSDYNRKQVLSWQKRFPEKTNEKQRRWYNKTKNILFQQILDHYGHICSCKNCPEKNESFLTLDHINGGGNKHRLSIGGQLTLNSYKDVIKKGFPPEYQILCLNCNWGKVRHSGKCPHE